ncbi:MAG: 4-alpha-glucanotransferase [Clostridia bacterium]|nr:4-alpha-glucanotransferase [Clostridia bacterium]
MKGMLFVRKSGILLSLSSIYGEYGIGDMGQGAYDFADFLKKSGQSFWQLLPLCRTDRFGSPYSSPSVFAGNPYYISVEKLYEQGLLTLPEKNSAKTGGYKADYAFLNKTRGVLLEKAAERLKRGTELERFIHENGGWLMPYALYTVLREKKGMSAAECMKLSKPEREKLYAVCNREIQKVCAVQYLFFFQWFNLKNYVNNNRVQLIGDIPVYTAYDSADVWENKELFMLDENCRPVFVAGCPPDDFSPDGQNWGNPVYNWTEHEKDDFRWWRSRFAHAGRLYDAVRIDHFRGFYSAYAVPAGRRDAREGRWLPSPGEKLVSVIKRDFPSLPVIAEDLGFITDEVREFFSRSGFPGMKVMQFSFSEDGERPYSFPENSVCYTGTHDNMTLCQWAAQGGEDVCRAMDYYGVNRVTGLPEAVIRGSMECRSSLCVIPMQDWLKKGADSRMNVPGTAQGNWGYRMAKGELSDELARKIRKSAVLYGRI